MKKQLVLGVVLVGMFFGFGFAGFARASLLPNSKENTSITVTSLGVGNVGTLPTSPFYFLKEWNRDIARLFTFFTFSTVAKAELELSIENQTAAEVLGVEKIYDACASNALGGGKHCNLGDIKNALENYTKAQERLNSRITAISADPSDASLAKLLKDVDEKTAKQAVLLNQSIQKHIGQPEYATLLLPYFEVDLNNTLKTFAGTFTVTNTGGSTSGALSVKQKATDEIANAQTAIQQAEKTFGQPVTFTATVVNSGGDQTYPGPYYIAIILNTSGGGFIDNGKSIIVDDRGSGFLKSAVVVDTTGFSVGQLIRIDNEFLTITAIKGNAIEFAPVTVTSVGVPIPFMSIALRASGGVSVPTDQRDFTTLTASDGSYTFTGLAPGKYDIFIAGQMVKSATDTKGTISGRTLVVYSDNHGEFMTIPMDIYTSAGVLIPLLKAGKNAGGTNIYDKVAGSNYWDSWGTDGPGGSGQGVYRFWTAIPSYVAIANAKGRLQSAKEALAVGTYGEAYGQARSAEATVGSIVATGENFPDTIAPPPSPTVSPKSSPKIETSKPSPKVPVLPEIKPVPEKTKTLESSDTKPVAPTSTSQQQTESPI